MTEYGKAEAIFGELNPQKINNIKKGTTDA
jgi:hypothetical protein